ncbi:hypothetical protein [Terrabacter aerolatus]|uniref:hypothetical protein n=1 Tax=Terrabacter aerolatus TaxID=422442 RepID=UPI0011BF58A1|nr:hypothetical protein [Terrabacter aerolatus]
MAPAAALRQRKILSIHGRQGLPKSPARRGPSRSVPVATFCASTESGATLVRLREGEDRHLKIHLPAAG